MTLKNPTDRILRFFKNKYPGLEVKILKGSLDLEVDRFLQSIPAEASTSMEYDGSFCIMVRDLVAGRAAIYEELAHVLQFARDGNVSIGTNDILQREVEVAECLMERGERLNLTDEEIRQTAINLDKYRSLLGV